VTERGLRTHEHVTQRPQPLFCCRFVSSHRPLDFVDVSTRRERERDLVPWSAIMHESECGTGTNTRPSQKWPKRSSCRVAAVQPPHPPTHRHTRKSLTSMMHACVRAAISVSADEQAGRQPGRQAGIRRIAMFTHRQARGMDIALLHRSNDTATKDTEACVFSPRSPAIPGLRRLVRTYVQRK